MGVTGSDTGATAQERHLVERARGGDRPAFRAIVEAHQDQVYRLALALTRDHHDAEDLVQDVFVQAYRSLDRFRGESQLATWLHRMTVNAAISAARRRRARPVGEPLHGAGGRPLPVADEGPAADPARAAEASAIRAAVARALTRLSEAERTVFLLHHHGEVPLVEVARSTGRADGTVRNLLHRALRKLRRELAGFVAARVGEAEP